jgi:hypothetical protein
VSAFDPDVSRQLQHLRTGLQKANETQADIARYTNRIEKRLEQGISHFKVYQKQHKNLVEIAPLILPTELKERLGSDFPITTPDKYGIPNGAIKHLIFKMHHHLGTADVLKNVIIELCPGAGKLKDDLVSNLMAEKPLPTPVDIFQIHGSWNNFDKNIMRFLLSLTSQCMATSLQALAKQVTILANPPFDQHGRLTKKIKQVVQEHLQETADTSRFNLIVFAPEHHAKGKYIPVNTLYFHFGMSADNHWGSKKARYGMGWYLSLADINRMNTLNLYESDFICNIPTQKLVSGQTIVADASNAKRTIAVTNSDAETESDDMGKRNKGPGKMTCPLEDKRKIPISLTPIISQPDVLRKRGEQTGNLKQRKMITDPTKTIRRLTKQLKSLCRNKEGPKDLHEEIDDGFAALQDECIHEIPNMALMAVTHPCNSLNPDSDAHHLLFNIHNHVLKLNKNSNCVMLPVTLCNKDDIYLSLSAYVDGGATVNYLAKSKAAELGYTFTQNSDTEIHQGAISAFSVLGHMDLKINIYDNIFQIRVAIPDVELPYQMFIGRKYMAEQHINDSAHDGCLYYHGRETVQKWPLIPMKRDDISRALIMDNRLIIATKNDPGFLESMLLVLKNTEVTEKDSIQKLESLLKDLTSMENLTHDSPEKRQHADFCTWLRKIKRHLYESGLHREDIRSVIRSLTSSRENPDRKTDFTYNFTDKDIQRYRRELIETAGFDKLWSSNVGISKLLITFAHLFRTDHLGANVDVLHKIDTGDAKPQKSNYYRMDPVKMRVVADKIHELLTQGLIRKSTSPWASPVVLVNKPDGTYRFCIDFRRVNSVTKMDAHAIPRIDYLLTQLGNKKVYSTCDMASGYWQIPMDPADIEKTAFTTFWGLYEFLVMPFGLLSATATFQRTMQQLFEKEIGQFVFAYVDDLIIFSESVEQHLFHLLAVFKKLSRAGFVLNFKKCHFMRKQVKYLGHNIDEKGISPDMEKVDKIRNLPTPRTQAQAFSFLQTVGYYRRFIEKFSWKAQSLFKCKPKSQNPLTTEQISAINILKDALARCFQLHSYDPSRPCIVVTDAALNDGVAALLSQLSADGKEVPIEFASKHSPMGDMKSQYEAECKGVIFALRKFRPYIIANQFIVRTDCDALAKAWRQKPENRNHGQWLVELQEYNFKAEHIRGLGNPMDYPSRFQPEDNDEDTPLETTYPPWETCDVQDILQRYLMTKHADDNERLEDYEKYASKFLRHRDTTPELFADNLGNVNQLLTLTPSTLVNSDPTYCLHTRSAKREHNIFEILFVLDERLKKEKEYLCRWKGYSAKHDTWEPVSNFVSNQAINEYLERKQCTNGRIEKLRRAQKEDSNLRDIFNKLANGQKTDTTYELDTRTLLIGKTRDNNFIPIIPKDHLHELIQEYHTSGLQVHPSTYQMEREINDKFICKDLRGMINRVVRSCQTCNMFNQSAPSPIMPTKLTSSAPWEIIEMDFIGPLPETEQGNKHILLIVDQFSKWPEAIPLKEKSAEIVATALIHLIITRHGTPDIIIHDSDSTFVARTIQEVMSQLGIRSLPTLPYTPRTHGLVERTVRTIRDKLARLCHDCGKDWDQCLDGALYALRTQYKKELKSTPFKIIYNRKQQDPSDSSLLRPQLNAMFNEALQDFHINMATAKVVNKRKKLATMKEGDIYDKVFKEESPHNDTYRVGDAVMLKDIRPRTTAEAKFRPRWHGPFIVSNTSRSTITVMDNDGCAKKHHKKDTRPYNIGALD